MSSWPRYPLIYEINAWPWLAYLSGKWRTSTNLRSVPEAEWDAIAAYGFDAVWLMGVWQRSPASSAIAARNPALVDDFKQALPDFQAEDNIGSAYSVRAYTVDAGLGGNEGLAVARRELARRGLRLILDFVPNHVALDHPWTSGHPEYFIRGSLDEAKTQPDSFVQVNEIVFAYGRDPYFPPWQDVLQLNAFHAGLRQASAETVAAIAEQCDGIRCDMAMLLLNATFERVWGGRAGPRPASEYWQGLISAVKRAHPGFLFIAEAYWDLEWELQQQGFDFCYDKGLYEGLLHGDPAQLRNHLSAAPGYQEQLMRFIENHDERRAAAAFAPQKERAAALIMASVPGAKLFHEGQFEGRRVRIPVFLARRPAEPADLALQSFYKRLLGAVSTPLFQEAVWTLCECAGWPDNESYRSLLAWSSESEDGRCLIVVNFSDRPAQGRVQTRWEDLPGRIWRLVDVLSGESYERRGDDMSGTGLYVELGQWGYHFFRVERLQAGSSDPEILK